MAVKPDRLLGTGLALATQWAADRVPSAPPPQAPADAWLDIRRPIPLFALSGTDFAKLPLDYAASRNGMGGRIDRLTFGDPHGDTPWLRLSLHRIGGEAASPGTIADDVVPLARDAGLALSAITPSDRLDTRFGPIEAMDLRAAGASGMTPCLGFRSVDDHGAPLRIVGLICGTADHPAERDLLGCVVDRIDLLSAGDDDAVKNLFLAAERRRGSGCMPTSLDPTDHQTTWLDANSPVPALKRLSGSAY